MRRMTRFLYLTLTLPALVLAAAPLAEARSPQSHGGPPVVVEYYYKIAPGGMMPGGPSEWLTLYLKNHHPILRQEAKEGLILSEKVYERRFHAESPAWDYKVVMVWRDWSALEQAHQREPDVIRVLYPNKEDHDRQEKRRWEITDQHWDDVLSEVGLD